MIKKKVCMLGAFAVGKTSLVQRYVHSIFSDRYHTTVGVKIEKTHVLAGSTPVDLIIWDLHGEDDFQHVRASYLKGSSGLILVVDGTRGETLKTALDLKNLSEKTMGPLPLVLAVNKLDLKDQWEIGASETKALEDQGIFVIFTSAKTGTAVEDAFLWLTDKMMDT